MLVINRGLIIQWIAIKGHDVKNWVKGVVYTLPIAITDILGHICGTTLYDGGIGGSIILADSTQTTVTLNFYNQPADKMTGLFICV